MPKSLLDLPVPAPSFWVKREWDRADIVVVGAGLVGLLTSIRLKEKFPRRSVWVLDQKSHFFAASWRNAGFACYGSAGELLDEAKRSSLDSAYRLYERRFRGLHALRQEFGDAALGFESSGGWEMFPTQEEAHKVVDQLESLNQDLHAIAGQFPFQPKAAKSLGMNFADTAIFAAQEGAIQTHLMMRSLRQKALSMGVELYEGVHVHALEAEGIYWRLNLALGWDIKAKSVFLCSNAYSSWLQDSLDVQAARGQVLVTSPIPDLPFRGIFHADEGYLYWRSLGTRLLIGGGRNQDFSGEHTFESQTSAPIQAHLMRMLREHIVPGKEFEIESQWAGIMAMAESREPIVKTIAPGLLAGVRMGGMGVALGADVAVQLAGLLEP